MVQAGKKTGETSASPEIDSSHAKKNGKVGDVGDALRSAYDRTVKEDVPAGLLELLGQLK